MTSSFNTSAVTKSASEIQHGHIVQFYETDHELASSVATFFKPLLRKGEAVILIATEAHRRGFEHALLDLGLNVPELVRSKQLVFLDAAETLAKFLVQDIPDPIRFHKIIGGLIDDSAKLFPKVNAFGEMVGLLLDAGNIEGTILLEQMWNDLARLKQFSLLCGYGMHQFPGTSSAPHFSRVCQEHSHVIPTGQTGNEGYSGAHYRIIAELQQREKALQHEIQERQRIELELRQNQIELNDFFDNAVVGLHLVGPDGTILRANKTELDMLGYSESEYVGRNIAEFHADAKTIEEILKRLSSRQTLRDCPARLKCKDGSLKHVLIDSNVYWENGNFRHTRCFTRNVTEKKQVEDALVQSQQRYQLLFDYSPLPKWIMDVETLQFVDVNMAAKNLFGYTKEEFLSLKATDLCPPEEVPAFREAMKRDYTAESQQLPRRFRHTKKDGTIIEADVSALDLMLNGCRHRIGAVVDVTERVAAEARQKELLANLAAAKEEAERANELKSAFLANMSHEIRTPLGAMVGFADLLRDPGLSREEHSNYINILTRNGEQLSTIINDILDLSKVEAGHLTLEFDDTKPDEIAADVVSLLRVKANEKSLVLEFKAEASTPVSLVTDSLRVRQILMNIVGNAVKFTQVGSVKIRSFGTTDSSGNTLYFEVTDTGIGIPEAAREKIFDAFIQADGTLVRKFGGTGLGLALSRKLAQELGGDLTIAKTAEGKGSTFLISIHDEPARRTGSSTRPGPQVNASTFSNEVLADIRVLVVDDSPDNRQLLWHFLTNYGATVDFAENGLLGYRKALNEKFDIVLMDIQMPEMDGYTATQKLRESGYDKPVIALTAHAMTEVRKKCLYVGCTDHLSKPIKPKELIGAVIKYTNARVAPVAVTTESAD